MKRFGDAVGGKVLHGFQRFQKDVRLDNGRQAVVASANQSPGGCSLGRRKLGEGFGEGLGELVGGEEPGLQADHSFVDREAGCSDGIELAGFSASADYDNLNDRQQKAVERESVTADVEAEVLDDSRECGQGQFAPTLDVPQRGSSL